MDDNASNASKENNDGQSFQEFPFHLQILFLRGSFFNCKTIVVLSTKENFKITITDKQEFGLKRILFCLDADCVSLFGKSTSEWIMNMFLWALCVCYWWVNQTGIPEGSSATCAPEIITL